LEKFQKKKIIKIAKMKDKCGKKCNSFY